MRFCAEERALCLRVHRSGTTYHADCRAGALVSALAASVSPHGPRRAQDLDLSVDLLRAMLDGKADVSTAQDVLKALCNTCARRRGMQ